MAFDFNSEHRDPQKFLACRDIRQLNDWEVNGEMVTSPSFMTDKELLEAIVEDILAFTMWEKQTGLKLDAGLNELIKHTSAEQQDRIKQALQHEDIRGLIVQDGDLIRIKDNPEILQAAMDYAGCWYSGFKMAEGAIVINHEALGDAIEQAGGIENLALAMSMEMAMTNGGNRTVN